MKIWSRKGRTEGSDVEHLSSACLIRSRLDAKLPDLSVCSTLRTKPKLAMDGMLCDERHKFWQCVLSIGRRVRACTRLSEPAKALTTRDYVRGVSGPSTLLNTLA
jgi:hypothetical protein